MFKELQVSPTDGESIQWERGGTNGPGGKRLENSAEEMVCVKEPRQVCKKLYGLKNSKPTESSWQVFMLVSDTIRFVFWMSTLEQRENGLLGEDVRLGKPSRQRGPLAHTN